MEAKDLSIRKRVCGFVKELVVKIEVGCSGISYIKGFSFVRIAERTSRCRFIVPTSGMGIKVLCRTCWNDVATYKMYITAAWKCTKQMITLVTTPNNLAYFRILSGPAWKENCAVLAKSSMGTRLRLHNIWEHCTCTDRQKKREKMNLSAFGCASRTRPSFPSMFNGLSHRRHRFANNWVIGEKGRYHK